MGDCRATTGLLAMNRVLRREFPPRKLKGLRGGRLYWRSPAAVARDRDMLARIAAAEARTAGGS
jgi:hypothetical protein